MQITASITFDGERADYFISELSKYLSLMIDGELTLRRVQKGDIQLALLSELLLDESDLKDPFTEDIIDINIVNCNGV